MTSLGEYVVDRLIKERNYDCLAYLIVSRLEELVKTLKKAYPKEREESLKEMAILLKREAMDRLLHPQMNVCPYCLSRRVENLDFEYECLECGRRFSRGWKDERLVKIVNAMYFYLKDWGMSDEVVKKYLFDVFGILLRNVREEDFHSEVDLLNLVSSTFLVMYDDPYFRNEFLKRSEVADVVRKREKDKFGRLSKEGVDEVKKEWEEQRLELDEEDKLVLSVLSRRRGLSYSEISKLTGLSYNRVKRIVKWLKRFGLVEVFWFKRRCLVVLK